MKKGYFVVFFTQQNRRHQDRPVAEWVLDEAKRLGVRGATVFSGKEGVGHDGRCHTDNYFDFEDSPVQVAMALTGQECDLLLARLAENDLRVFFTKSEIEFGFTTED